MSIFSHIPFAGANLTLTAAQRRLRILLYIIGFYLLWNPSGFSISQGLVRAFRWGMNLPPDSGLNYFVMALVFATAIFIILLLARRYGQAIKDTNIVMLSAQTLLVAAIIGFAMWGLVIAGWMRWDWSKLPMIMGWTLQIVVGYFIGKGLNWTIEDRAMAGIQGVQGVGGGHHGHGNVIGHVDPGHHTN